MRLGERFIMHLPPHIHLLKLVLAPLDSLHVLLAWLLHSELLHVQYRLLNESGHRVEDISVVLPFVNDGFGSIEIRRRLILLSLDLQRDRALPELRGMEVCSEV